MRPMPTREDRQVPPTIIRIHLACPATSKPLVCRVHSWQDCLLGGVFRYRCVESWDSTSLRDGTILRPEGDGASHARSVSSSQSNTRWLLGNWQPIWQWSAAPSFLRKSRNVLGHCGASWIGPQTRACPRRRPLPRIRRSPSRVRSSCSARGEIRNQDRGLRGIPCGC